MAYYEEFVSDSTLLQQAATEPFIHEMVGVTMERPDIKDIPDEELKCTHEIADHILDVGYTNDDTLALRLARNCIDGLRHSMKGQEDG